MNRAILLTVRQKSRGREVVQVQILSPALSGVPERKGSRLRGSNSRLKLRSKLKGVAEKSAVQGTYAGSSPVAAM